MTLSRAFNLLLLVPFILSACCSTGHPEKSTRIVSSGNTAQVKDSFDVAVHQQRYEKLCDRIETKRKSLAAEYEKATDDVSKKAIERKAAAWLEKILADSVFVYWYDTKWDFNGVTQKPRQGNIACGYFVTTTLRQAGLPLQRVWMAQQASSVMINKLCESDQVKTISNNQLSKLKTYLLSKEDGLWIIGLDNHTGFVQKSGSNLDFIHACYNPVQYVRREKLDGSPIIQSSGIYMVGRVFGGQRSIQAWLTGNGDSIKGGS